MRLTNSLLFPTFLLLLCACSFGRDGQEQIAGDWLAVVTDTMTDETLARGVLNLRAPDWSTSDSRSFERCKSCWVGQWRADDRARLEIAVPPLATAQMSLRGDSFLFHLGGCPYCNDDGRLFARGLWRQDTLEARLWEHGYFDQPVGHLWLVRP